MQEKIRRRQHPPGETRHTLFAGLLICGECGKHLTFRKTHAKKPLDIYACATYNKFGKQVARDKKRLSDDEALETDTKAWLNEIGTYADIKELDPATINRLVKEIIVHETVKSLSGKRNLTRRTPHRRIRSFTVPVY